MGHLTKPWMHLFSTDGVGIFPAPDNEAFLVYGDHLGLAEMRGETFLVAE